MDGLAHWQKQGNRHGQQGSYRFLGGGEDGWSTAAATASLR